LLLQPLDELAASRPIHGLTWRPAVHSERITPARRQLARPRQQLNT
jgi:hypothetical protein